MGAVCALGNLQVSGVCKQLLKIAQSEKGELSDRARAGIAATALPDAAGELLKGSANTDKALAEECR